MSNNVGTQTEEPYVVINDPSYMYMPQYIKEYKNIFIFFNYTYNYSYENKIDQSTLTQYNKINDAYTDSFIKQLRDSGDL